MNQLITTMFALAVACATMAVPAQDLKPDAAQGATKVAMCIGCHGIAGYQASFPQIYQVPMIAGQSETYIRSALSAYKAGERKHPTMRAVAGSMTPQDILDLAAYYSKLGLVGGSSVSAVPVKAPSERVQALITRDKENACTKCHGVNFNTPNDATVAKLAGQHPDYLLVALKAYKTDNNPQVGRAHAVMSVQARKFTDNADLKELAQYISGLPGDLKVVPQSRMHYAAK